MDAKPVVGAVTVQPPPAAKAAAPAAGELFIMN